MDALSDVLRVVRMKGGVFLNAEFSAPWCVASQVASNDCRALLDGADHLVLYHYVVEGCLKARMSTGEEVEIGAGEVFMLPHNDRHLLGTDFNLSPVPTSQLVSAPTKGGLWEIRHGGGGRRTRIVCGFLGCDRLNGNPLIDALPSMLTFDARQGSSAILIKSSLEFASDELSQQRAGSATMLAKVSELLFIEAVRRHVESMPPEQTGWLAALKDPIVSRALVLLHRRVAHSWTVDELGREVGLSRSALAERFSRLLGEPPMRYLARWRLHVAAHDLRHSDLPLGRIAQQVGYESEAAFNRAFKRDIGMPPATWRKTATTRRHVR